MPVEPEGRSLKPRFPGLSAFLTGMIAILVIYSLSKAGLVLGLRRSGGVSTWPFAFLTFLLAGVRMGWPLRASAWQGPQGIWQGSLSCFVAANAGIAVGVVGWAFLEERIFRHLGTGTYPIYEDHNLFPFEILAWWVIGAVPLLLGISVGVLRKHLGYRAGRGHG